MQLTTSIFAIVAATAVSAHPSMRHGHGHNHVVRDGPFFAASKPTLPSVPSTTDAVSGPKSFSCSSTKRATAADIAYGVLRTPYGCNWMEVNSADTTNYDYTMTFKAMGDKPVTCQCWNKLGPDGGVNGMWQDMLKLTVPAGGNKSVAVMENTQGACGCAEGEEVPKSSFGMWLGTWVEVDMGNTRNLLFGKPNSGADVSTLGHQDSEAQGPVTGMKLIVHPKEGVDGTDPKSNYCSGVSQNLAKTFQAYVVSDANKNIHDADGIGCKDYGPHNLEVQVGSTVEV